MAGVERKMKEYQRREKREAKRRRRAEKRQALAVVPGEAPVEDNIGAPLGASMPPALGSTLANG